MIADHYLYTSKALTGKYLKKLEKWEKNLERAAKKYMRDPFKHKIPNLLFDHELPEFSRGDIILILDVDAFSGYYPPFYLDSPEDDEQRQELHYLVKTTFKVTGRTGSGFVGDMSIRNKKGFREHIFLPHIVIEEVSKYSVDEEPEYIWLPHPSNLKYFKNFFPFLSKEPKKLEKTLRDYYSHLPS